jgi:ribokinase
MPSLDFLAIGDIVTEPFIRLKEARVNCRVDDETCEICMRWGDKIPYESATLVAAVGNASNAAVAAARLGLSSSLRAYVGDDRYGKECIEVLESEKVDTSYMVTEPGKNTNYHYVLWFENERTILVKHEDFTYQVPELSESPKWVYLSSLSENSLPYHEALVRMLDAHPETKLAFQPGTFQMKLGAEALRPLYERSDFFVCNKEEAARILGIHTDDIKELLSGMHALGPKLVAITDGTKGAYAFDGTQAYFVPMYPDARGPYERTGAGDAFASTVVAALALGKPIEEALLWGPINSMSVVQDVGAQRGLLTREALETYLKDAPAEYRVQPI